MKIKKIIAIILVGVGIVSAGAVEALAAPLLVDQGFYQTSAFGQNATYSGDNLAVGYSIGGGIFLGDAKTMFYEAGILIAVFGRWTPPPSVPAGVFVGPGPGSVQVGNISCAVPFQNPTAPDCGGILTFTNPAIGPPPGGSFTADAPFTMTGQLILGQVGLPNMIVDIQGSGTLHALSGAGVMDSVRYEFAPVPEPSTLALVASALVAGGWRRSRGGKRPVSGLLGLADSGRHDDRT